MSTSTQEHAAGEILPVMKMVLPDHPEVHETMIAALPHPVAAGTRSLRDAIPAAFWEKALTILSPILVMILKAIAASIAAPLVASAVPGQVQTVSYLFTAEFWAKAEKFLGPILIAALKQIVASLDAPTPNPSPGA